MTVRPVVLAAALALGAGGVANAQISPFQPPQPFTFAPPGCEPGAAPGWCYQSVDARRNFSDMGPRSLAFDASSYPHIAYGGSQLYHAWRDGIGWHTEVVDPSWNVGHATSMAVDHVGRLQIAYYDSAKKQVKFAIRQTPTAKWYTFPVVSAGFDVGGTPEPRIELAVDQFNEPHIVYTDFAFVDGQLWQQVRYTFAQVGVGPGYFSTPAVVGKSRSIGQGLSMVVDPGMAGTLQVHVSYRDCDTYLCWMNYANRAADGQWHTQPVLFHLKYPFQPWESLAHYGIGVDALHRPTILFDAIETFVGDDNTSTVDYGSLRLTYFDDNEWIRPDIGWGDGMITWGNWRVHDLSFAFDPSSVPAGDTTRDLWCAAVQLDEEPEPYASKTSLWVWTGPTAVSAIESNGDTGFWPSVAIPPSHYAGVSFFDRKNSELHFRQSWTATYSDALPVWGPLETVDTSGNVGMCPSIQLNQQGRPAVVYFDEIRRELLHRNMTATGWTEAVHVDPGHAGTSQCTTGLALSRAGLPSVVFVTTERELIYARMVCGTTCEFDRSVVDSDVDDHSAVAVVMDSRSLPQIAYSKDGRLTIASLNHGNWLRQVVDPNLEVWGQIRLDVDSSGGLHVLYTNWHGSGGLHYARRKGTNWTLFGNVPIAEQGEEPPRWVSGSEYSLALGAGGLPVITYADRGTLKIVRADALPKKEFMIWLPPETVHTYSPPEDEWLNLVFLDSAVDTTGRVHITFNMTRTNHGLWYVTTFRGTSKAQQIVSGDLGFSPLAADGASGPAMALTNTGKARIAYYAVGSLYLAWEGPFLAVRR